MCSITYHIKYLDILLWICLVPLWKRPSMLLNCLQIWYGEFWVKSIYAGANELDVDILRDSREEKGVPYLVLYKLMGNECNGGDHNEGDLYTFWVLLSTFRLCVSVFGEFIHCKLISLVQGWNLSKKEKDWQSAYDWEECASLISSWRTFINITIKYVWMAWNIYLCDMLFKLLFI